jgi:EmrB/QacA subfamily drug resistance transporter
MMHVRKALVVQGVLLVSAPTTIDPPAPAGAAHPKRWVALGLLALIQFIIILDSTVVNVALPSIQRGLHFTPTGLAWVIDGYLIMAGGLLLLGGRLADLLGRRRMFLVGTVVFALASALSGFAQDPAMLVASRFLQGTGEAIASPAAFSLVAVMFTEQKERTQAFGIWGGLAGLGGTLGVVLSGIITDLASWRWIFFINLPFAAIALALVPRYAPESRPAVTSRRVDVAGAILATGGLVALVDGLLEGVSHAWGSLGVAGPLAAGIVALAAFFVVEARSATPLLPLRFLTNRTRGAGYLLMILTPTSWVASFFLLTLYVQGVLHYSAMRAGLAYLPMGLAVITGVVLTTGLSNRFGQRTPVTIGYLLAAAGMFGLSRLGVDSGFLAGILPATVVFGLGLGFTFPMIGVVGMHQVDPHEAGLGSGVSSTVQQVGGALGLSVMATIALRVSHHPAASAAAAATHGYTTAFAAITGVLIAAALAARTLLPGTLESTAEAQELLPVATVAEAMA